MTHRLPEGSDARQATRKILEALHGLRFGSVEITVHDGRIVQIERKEKVRLNLPGPSPEDDGPESRNSL